jgi:hypothetical protein
VGVILGVYLVFFNEDCKPFAWLVCQLNALHFPMCVWYWGCRKNCFSKSSRVQHLCRVLFPPLWLFVSAYRLSCLVFSSCWAWYAHSNATAGASGVLFALVLGYLDKNWTDFFFQELGCSTKKSQGTSVTWNFVTVQSVYTLGTVLGFITVFYL